VKLEIAKGVASVEQKQAVIRGMTDVLVKELGRNPEYVFVVIDEVDTDNWGRKGLSLTELARQSATPPMKDGARRPKSPKAKRTLPT
jgi:4-oxalocrotonate tautomerase